MTEKKQLTRQELRRRRKKRQLIIKSILLCVMLVVLAAAIWILVMQSEEDIWNLKDLAWQSESGSSDAVSADASSVSGEISGSNTEEPVSEEEPAPDRESILAQAELLAAGYDYDGAVAALQTIPGADTDPDIITKIAEYNATKNSCVRVNISEVTHIFYHSLVVDPQRAFFQDNPATEGFCEWMTTVDEFNRITEQMYEKGYVLVSLYDLVNQTTDEAGTVHFTEGDIYLPEGKKAYVLSLDDLSYYHSYDGRGIATKMIVGEDGKPTCEYVQPDGTTVVGAYDCIPLMDQFLAAHPDASYHGAKGTVALTGYNGILGYRTDGDYQTRENLSDDQAAWLNAHPDFNYEQECEEARKVADAIKADGWTFASHTWGHIRIGDASLERIQTDTEKWLTYVAPLIGGSDIIIFAHGQDLADWHDYSADNEKFSYLKSKGFNIYCNVDSSQYFVQVRDNYLRMGRRNLDGYRLYQDAMNGGTRTNDLFDAVSVFDSRRPTDPALYDLQ